MMNLPPQRLLSSVFIYLLGTTTLLVSACVHDPAIPLAGVATVQVTGITDKADKSDDLSKIKHFVVIFLENHSFDSLYGRFPDPQAETLSSPAAQTIRQIDWQGHEYLTLPHKAQSKATDKDFPNDLPSNLPNAPYLLDALFNPAKSIPDLTHLFYQQQMQINGGKMDKFVAFSNQQGLSMGYYATEKLPLFPYARDYALLDHFHHAAFGGSFLNHIWLIAARTPVFDNAPRELKPQLAKDSPSHAIVDKNGQPQFPSLALDAVGNIIEDGKVTSDNYVVNTSFSAQTPGNPVVAEQRSFANFSQDYPMKSRSGDHLVPLPTYPTIGELLSGKDIKWKWYAGGWDEAVKHQQDPAKRDTAFKEREFQYHHQAFTYFQAYAAGTQNRAEHLRDEAEFLRDVQVGTLPAVSFIEPAGEDSEHPGYANLMKGEQHTKAIVDAVLNSSACQDTAIIVTYDENGGLWDHVAPPMLGQSRFADQWGPGARVPAIIISPYAKRHFVDHTQYDTTSILAFIESRWNLGTLATRDKVMKEEQHDLRNAFDFSQMAGRDTCRNLGQ